jgi:hypothetical protein
MQLLRDADIEPTSEIIAEGLGAANAAYLKFIDELKHHDIQVDWRFYNDGKAWLGKALYKWTTARGTQKEMTAFWLSIWDGFFRVSLFIPEKVRAEALALKLSGETKNMIADSKQMGKLKFFPLVFDLRTDDLFDDIYTLADFRITIK